MSTYSLIFCVPRTLTGRTKRLINFLWMDCFYDSDNTVAYIYCVVPLVQTDNNDRSTLNLYNNMILK